jgi:hypothetical protein
MSQQLWDGSTNHDRSTGISYLLGEVYSYYLPTVAGAGTAQAKYYGQGGSQSSRAFTRVSTAPTPRGGQGFVL